VDAPAPGDVTSPGGGERYDRHGVTHLPTDAPALRRRVDAHQRFSTRDLTDWILETLAPGSGERILDVGCGLGRQAVALAERVGPSGVVVGLDASADALAEARAEAGRRGLGQAQFVEARMEAVGDAVAGHFHAFLCSFALYYAASPRQVLEAVRSRLLPGGRGLVCGPARSNNRAFVELCDRVVPREDQTRRVEASLTFLDVEGPPLFLDVFGAAELLTFENPVSFPTPDDVVTYWRSYHLYSPRHEDAFRRAVEEHFAAHGVFRTVKVVRGALVG
jgi:SAM-dependent methyltransferase